MLKPLWHKRRHAREKKFIFLARECHLAAKVILKLQLSELSFPFQAASDFSHYNSEKRIL